jgi:MFS family permease
MTPTRVARVFRGHVHYAWIALIVMFLVTLGTVGVRAAPGVMIVPLEHSFGWSVATISAAVSINILLMGALGPFVTGLMETIGIRRTLLLAMAVLAAATGLSVFMTAPWEMFLTWGVLVGVGTGAGSVGVAAAMANRWFVARRGLAMGLMTSAGAGGQLVFLPVLAALSQRYGWQSVALAVTLVVAAMIPVVLVLLPESPGSIGLGPYGLAAEPAAEPRAHDPFTVAIHALRRGTRSLDFWLLALTFGVCGFSTNGLVATHLIAYCVDHGINEVTGASVLAALGVFNMTDRVNPRVLLFWYYGLRGLSLAILPFTNFNVISLSAFAVFYGLDWVATVPPTFALTTEVFGRKDAPVIMSWVAAAHQIGGAMAAFGAGEVRSLTGSYLVAFISSGLACLLAAVLVLRITRTQPVGALAAE